MADKESETSERALSVTPDAAAADIKYSKGYVYSNVYGLGIALLLNGAAILGLVSLQSSINEKEGLGLASLSVYFGSSSLIGFVTAGILTVFGTKFSLVIGFGCRVVIIVCNYYPTWYTLIPGAVLSGFGSTITWASMTAHVTGVAELIAPSFDKDRVYLVSKYTGIVFFFYYAATIPGNLASSLIFYPYNYNATEESELSNYSGNETTSSCGRASENSERLDEIYLYSLLSVYVVSAIASILVSMFCLSHLPTENNFFSTNQKFQLYFRKPFLQLLRVLVDKRMLLIAPILLASALVDTFAFGTYTEVGRDLLC